MNRWSAYDMLDPDDDSAWTTPDHWSALPAWIRRLIRTVPMSLFVLGVLIAAVVAYDAVTIGSNSRASASMSVATAATKQAQSELLTTTSEIASTTTTRNTRQMAASRAQAQVESVRKSLTAAAQAGALQTLDITALHTCLTGVSGAVTAFSMSNSPGALSAINGASSACLSLDTSGGGLVYPFNFPDPFVLTTAKAYFAFGTNSAGGNIQILQSSDLDHWTTVGDALPHLAAWAQPGATGAPSVLQRGGTYVLYYSALDGTTGDQCISEAVAGQPQGPYVDTSKGPLVCQLDLGGSIDPSPYIAGGNLYLTWKSQGSNGQPPTLWAQEMTPSGTALASGTPTALLTPTQSWQAGVVEGPDMLVSGGQYQLFYAGNNSQTAGYAIGVASCSGPLGPCTDDSSQPLVASDSTMSGPGGPDAFVDTQGNLWIAFAAWLPGEVGSPNSRPLFLRRVTESGGVPQVAQ
jgi:Glycosyl hydrolases family 43